MVRITPSPKLRPGQTPRQSPASYFALVALHVVGAVVGVGMTLLVWRHVEDLGAGAHLVNDLLALDAAPSAAGSISSVARDSGSGLLYFAALACASGAALALLIGTCLAIAGGGHRRTGHRLTAVGLWLALIVCLMAMLPLDGYPFAAASASAAPAVPEWGAAPRALAFASVAGLLLSAIAGEPRRAAQRASV